MSIVHICKYMNNTKYKVKMFWDKWTKSNNSQLHRVMESKFKIQPTISDNVKWPRFGYEITFSEFIGTTNENVRIEKHLWIHGMLWNMHYLHSLFLCVFLERSESSVSVCKRITGENVFKSDMMPMPKPQRNIQLNYLKQHFDS